MKSAFSDFYERFQGGERLLSDHRFWRLLRDVRSRVENATGAKKGEHAVHLMLCFGVDDYDLSMEFTLGLRPGSDSAAMPGAEVSPNRRQRVARPSRDRNAWPEVAVSMARGGAVRSQRDTPLHRGALGSMVADEAFGHSGSAGDCTGARRHFAPL